jgi:hypothetical protein
MINAGFTNLFLDSGAFTLRQSYMKDHASATKTEENEWVMKYIDQYVDFMNTYGDAFTIAAEVDVGTWQQKTRYREIIESKKKSKVTLVPVIHRADPTAYVEYVCAHYPYVAFAGLKGYSIKNNVDYMGKRMVTAKKHGTQIHGFALTTVEIMLNFGMCSVDSASWVHGSKHGMTFYFDGRELRSYDKFNKWVRVKFKNEVKNLGINWDDFMDDKSTAIDAWNLAQWVAFQKYVDEDGRLGRYKMAQEDFWRKKDTK